MISSNGSPWRTYAASRWGRSSQPNSYASRLCKSYGLDQQSLKSFRLDLQRENEKRKAEFSNFAIQYRREKKKEDCHFLTVHVEDKFLEDGTQLNQRDAVLQNTFTQAPDVAELNKDVRVTCPEFRFPESDNKKYIRYLSTVNPTGDIWIDDRRRRCHQATT